MSKSIQEILNEQRKVSEIFKKSQQSISVSSHSKLKNEEDYKTHKWILRSPGNDLLDFYDEQNNLLGTDNRAYSAIPPSQVFHIRFRMDLPTPRIGNNQGGRAWEIKQYCKPWKQSDDPSYWGQIYKKRYDWLVDKPHESYEFDYKKDLEEFLQNKFKQKAVFINCCVNTANKVLKNKKDSKMYWRGELRGWSIVVIPN